MRFLGIDGKRKTGVIEGANLVYCKFATIYHVQNNERLLIPLFHLFIHYLFFFILHFLTLALQIGTFILLMNLYIQTHF